MKTIEAQVGGPEFIALLDELERSREPVCILRGGRPVANLSPVAPVRDPLVPNPRLQGVEFFYDPTEPLSNEEWPEEYR